MNISVVQLETSTICAVTCQVDAAIGRGDIAPLNADTVPLRLGSTVEADIAAGRGQGAAAADINPLSACR
ncbi:Uncharacterised protein [Escherichia coli]|nr:Uncharacterised protein [Escherichia coli]